MEMAIGKFALITGKTGNHHGYRLLTWNVIGKEL